MVDWFPCKLQWWLLLSLHFKTNDRAQFLSIYELHKFNIQLMDL